MGFCTLCCLHRGRAAHSFPVFPFPAMFFQNFASVRPGRRGAVREGRQDDIIPLPPLGGELSFPGPGGGRFFLSPQGGVHSLVKISSFLGKKRPFPSCVLRKFLLYCIHTGVRLSDDIFTMTGSIWYDVPRDSQCLTTSGNPIEDGAQATDSIKMSPAVRQGRPDGRAHDKSSRRRREF